MSIMYFLINLLKWKRLKIGDRIKLWGGYESIPSWLCGKNACYGQVIKFISGPYKTKDAIVQLNEAISCMNFSGKFLILTLRYKDAVWGKSEIVHLHLHENIPQGNEWCTNQNEWDNNHIESHASYAIEK